jgi:hypothetical protein
MFRVTFVVTNVELVIVHYSRLLKLPSERNGGRRGSNSFRSAHDFRPSRVSKHFTSTKPKVKPVKDAYWKKDSASHQESPKALCKASEDMGKPSGSTECKNDLSHHLSL